MNLYTILEIPIIYKISQFILAPGSRKLVFNQLKPYLSKNRDLKCLDVGCGPLSKCNEFGIYPDGIDLSKDYIEKFNQSGSGNGYVSSSEVIPFDDNTYDIVYCFALLHHLDDKALLKTVSEMIRVAKKNGKIVITDAIYPKNKWDNILAHVIRKYDRGKYVRTEDRLTQLLNKSMVTWKTKRIIVSYTGLESLLCIYSGNQKLD